MRDTPIQSDADLERWQAAAKAELEARRIDVQLKLEYTLKRQQEEYENYLQQLEQAWLVFKAGEVEERAEEDKTL
jgi:hypothetical protein